MVCFQIGTLAGNLALKNSDPSFQSDIFLLLDCVGATVTLGMLVWLPYRKNRTARDSRKNQN